MSNEPLRLSDLLSEVGEETISSLLSTFRCTADADAEYFLKNRAVMHEKDSVSRTYILLKSDYGKPIIKGYYTLAMKCLAIDEKRTISKKMRKEMNINNGIAQSYLLGQLAKADGVEKGFGKIMINRALDTFGKGKEMFGCRTLRLDCKNESKLIDYYISCGFKPIGRADKGDLNRMVMIF